MSTAAPTNLINPADTVNSPADETTGTPAADLMPAADAPAAATPDTATPADTRAADRAMQAAVRRLLAGSRPGDLPHPPRGGYGRWAPLLGDLCAAWAAGGTRGVQDQHVALATSDAVYCTLTCADLPPEETGDTGNAARAGETRRGMRSGGKTGRDDRALTSPDLMPADPCEDPYEQSPEERGWTIRELLMMESEPIEFVIDGLIPVGVTNIAGRPKIGKSWFTLQLLVAADAGLPFLGFPTAGGQRLNACYLALEDSKNRLIDRLKKVTGSMALDLAQAGGSLLRTRCAPLSADGLQQVRHILESGCKLLIIDTFSRFLGRGDQMDQQEMTLTLGALQRLAFEHHAAVVVVDHHRKSARTSPDADPIDDIMGATAKAGVVDCAIGLYRRHKDNEAALKLCGRDFGDSELSIEWDPDAFRWLRKETKARKNDKPQWTLREQEAIDAVGDLGHATLRELADQLGQDRSNLYTRLQGLCRRGALDCVQTARGCEYVIPAPAVNTVGHVSDVTPPPAAPSPAAAPVVPVVPVVSVVPVVPAADVVDEPADQPDFDDEPADEPDFTDEGGQPMMVIIDNLGDSLANKAGEDVAAAMTTPTTTTTSTTATTTVGHVSDVTGGDVTGGDVTGGDVTGGDVAANRHVADVTYDGCGGPSRR